MVVTQPQFDRIARRTIWGEVRERLTQSILRGEFPPGSRLPSERALSEAFGVGRTSIREALQGLVSLELVERRGNRTYVRERLPDIQVPRDDGRKQRVRELFEVRRIIEVPIAELAARRASETQRREIRAIAEEFSPDMPLEPFRTLDRAFHSAIAQASGNPLLAELHAKVLDALFASPEFASLLTSELNADVVQRIVSESGAAHHAIAAAVLDGDGKKVVEGAERHLDQVEERMISQLV